MKIARFSFGLFLICLLGTNFVFSQKKNEKDLPPQPIEIKANVLVLDEKGSPPNDIKAEDLKVFEDGVEQKITYFVKKEPVLNLGLVVDNTGSMRTRLDKVMKASTTIIDYLKPNDRAFIVRFVDSEKTAVWEDWSSDKSLLKKAVGNMFIEGGMSAVFDGLFLGVAKMSTKARTNEQGQNALILISDSEDRNSVLNLEKVLEKVKETNSQVFVVALIEEDSYDKKTKKEAEKLAAVLALETGGTAYFSKSNKANLDNTIQSIMNELKSQYIIGYSPINQKRDGKTRKLSAQVSSGATGEKRQAFIRESFIVPKN